LHLVWSHLAHRHGSYFLRNSKLSVLKNGVFSARDNLVEHAGRIWRNSLVLEVVHDLARDLLQHLLR